MKPVDLGPCGEEVEGVGRSWRENSKQRNRGWSTRGVLGNSYMQGNAEQQT